MKIDIGSCAFNIKHEQGNTPSWGTSIGRQDDTKLIYSGCSDLIVGMVHKAVESGPIDYGFGKNKNNQDGNQIVLTAIFDKIYVNNIKVENAKFLLFIVEQLSGETLKHHGRKTLKYPKNCSYKGEQINLDCYTKMAKALGVIEQGSWFVTDISVKDQEELHFNAIVLNKFDSTSVTKETKDQIYESAGYISHEEDYKNWLASKSEYSEGTKKNYLSVIRSLSKEICVDIFHVDSIDKIDEIYDLYKSNPSYVEDDKNSNYTRSNGLKNYMEYLHEALRTKVTGGINKYFYGAPGCGKSYHVKKLLQQSNVSEDNIYRVTFHPEYSNTDFVGQILPTIEKVTLPDGRLDEKVKYIFNPGPFTKALLRSYQTDEMVYLVVEELNRGNASAIFGDLFQLLDREDDTSKSNFSESMYPVTNVNIFNYIKDELAKKDKKYRNHDIIIPSNLTILATMNTSDQNVFTLDTAFKRRWKSEGINNNIVSDNEHKYKKWFVPGTHVTWETFLTKLNDKILEYKIENSTSEDKRLGKYFVGKDCLTEKPIDGTSECKDEAHNFAYKVLEYIWNDVCKYGQSDWFDTQKYRTLEDLLEGYNDEQLGIFQNIRFSDIIK